MFDSTQFLVLALLAGLFAVGGLAAYARGKISRRRRTSDALTRSASALAETPAVPAAPQPQPAGPRLRPHLDPQHAAPPHRSRVSPNHPAGSALPGMTGPQRRGGGRRSVDSETTRIPRVSHRRPV